MDGTLGHALEGWQSGGGPLYRRLADALRAAIAAGAARVGERLPTERSLAAGLSVSRATVVAAYDALRDEGWLERRQGSGTWVKRGGPGRRYGEDRPGVLGRSSESFRALIEGPGDAIEFTVAAVPAPDLFVREDIVQEALATLVGASRETGYLVAGHPAIRRALAAYVTDRGLPTTEDQIIVTTGAQQAIALTADLYAGPGDAVVVEDPTFLSALDRFAALGVRLAPVPVGPRGVRADDVRAAALEHGARFAYLIPAFHNPTGTLVPEPERRALAEVSAELQLPIVDDMTLADVSLGPPPGPPLASFVPDAPIVTIGSLSKLYWGGLRLGFVRGPEPLITRLARMKLVADHGSSVVAQAFAAALLPDAEGQRRRRSAFARERYDLLAALLTEHVPDWRWQEPAGGLCLWVRLPGADAGAFAEFATRHSVAVVPGPMSSPTGRFTEYLRLPYVHEPDVLEEGVQRLAAAWRAFRREPSDSGSRRLRVVV